MVGGRKVNQQLFLFAAFLASGLRTLPPGGGIVKKAPPPTKASLDSAMPPPKVLLLTPHSVIPHWEAEFRRCQHWAADPAPPFPIAVMVRPTVPELNYSTLL